MASGQGQTRSVSVLLFESLCYALIEKGVLTRNDALSVIQTVAEVKRGGVDDGSGNGEDAVDLVLLHRLFTSFEALDDQPGAIDFSAANVHHLRPPVHENRPEFPEDG